MHLPVAWLYEGTNGCLLVGYERFEGNQDALISIKSVSNLFLMSWVLHGTSVEGYQMLISHLQELSVLLIQLSFLFSMTVSTAEYLLGWHASICEADSK